MEKTRCYCDINVSNFIDNVKGLQALLNGESKIIGILKANLYGHGAIKLAKIMKQQGINDFAVAAVSEAIELRDAGIEGSILILSYTEESMWMIARQCDCILSCTCIDDAKKMSEFAKNHNIKMKIEIAVDTGMHRIGVSPECSDEDLKVLYDNPYLQVNGTFSHLCRADSFNENDKQYTLQQEKIFNTFINRVKDLGLDTGRTHLCASSGILNYPQFKYDYVRPGFMLLGFDVGETAERYDRKPVLSWYTKVEMVKDVENGEGISYGHIYHTQGTRKIATLSVGYADGYPRCLSNKGYVMIHGQKAPIVGRICMDQMMVDVTDIDDVKTDDLATLIGEGVTANQLAEMAGTIVDEIVCQIADRVERYYI